MIHGVLVCPPPTHPCFVDTEPILLLFHSERQRVPLRVTSASSMCFLITFAEQLARGRDFHDEGGVSVNRGFLCRTSKSMWQRLPLQPHFKVKVLSQILRICKNFGNCSVYSLCFGGRDTSLLCLRCPHHTATQAHAPPPRFVFFSL